MSERVESLLVEDGSSMGAFVAVPVSEGPHPAVIVISGAAGVDTSITDIARHLAGEGYYAIAPDLFHRLDSRDWDGKTTRAPKLTDTWIIADIEASISYIQSHIGIQGNPIGIIGFCMGGRVSLLGATINPSIGASICFYPGNSMAPRADGPSAIERLKNAVCPILCIFGANDENPSPNDMQQLSEELKKYDKEHEFHSMPNAGHNFMDSYNEQTYRASASEAAWPLVTSFLKKHLASS